MQRRTITRGLAALAWALVLVVTVQARLPQDRPSTASSLAAVSGTVRHNGSPVAGILVNVVWGGGGHEATTGADGRYSVSGVATGGWTNIHIRPPLHLRLEYRNWGTESLGGDVVRDFELGAGYLLSGEVRKPDGQLYEQDVWLGLRPLDTTVPEGEWLGDGTFQGRFQMVVTPGIYTLDATMSPFFLPRTVLDLRSGDQTGVVINLLSEPQPAVPTDPPIAERISVGPANIDGLATVTGVGGAVPPLSKVLVANLNSRNVSVCLAESDGRFQTQLYAPPGSALLIKSDPSGERLTAFWEQLLSGVAMGDLSLINPLPGTIVNVGPPAAGGGTSQAFRSAGGWWHETQRLWAGWAMSGTLSVQGGGGSSPGLPVQRGQSVRLTASLRVTSPAMSCSGQPSAHPRLHIHLMRLFANDGRQEARGIWFHSYLLTPTGLPIEHEGGGRPVPVISSDCSGLTCLSSRTFEGNIDTTFQIPGGVPDGIYMVRAYVEDGGVPMGQELATAPVWYSSGEAADMPLLRVGTPQAPRISWVLLGDVPANGHRGLVAREDEGHYALSLRSLYAPHRVIVPRLDERSQQPVAYGLEPGSLWLSSTDRRLPCAPLIPLVPAGTLTVKVQRPDGRTDTLGPAPIRQPSVRTPTVPSGDPIDHGTGHLGDLYHLTTLDERFAYEFPLDGHYVITLSGDVQDVYGNAYGIAGTYEVDVARVLDLDPAQLPTTPYKQGDAFAPGLHIFPPVPAEVTIKLVQMPNSDPARATTRTITGRANRFGYFQPPAGTDIRMTAAGEFRVDYTAAYTSPDGSQWLGAMTWGSVIEGPSPKMEAHGRRGMDYEGPGPIDDMPIWFEVFELPPEKVGIENYYPYYSGDVHWGNEDRAPGDSIHSIITVKDLTGSRQIYNLLRANYPRATNGFRWPPADMSLAGLEQRIAIGEAPLFITTDNGDDPKTSPERINQWGYWYGSSERPDVHVREIISEDNMGTAYWRFEDTYGYQIGEPANGDQPGDIKWEFGGAVLRAPSQGINEYAIYSSFWVLLPHGCDAFGCARVTPPFQDATGASINGGPLLTIKGQDIDMLFLPKGVRPGDVLEVGDVVAFSGHVGPPLDSRVSVTITSPSGAQRSRTWHANKIGWLYDPSFDFAANETGRWTVDVQVLHDRPYVGNGVIPQSHNTGTVMGTQGRYEFYVVPVDAPRLTITSPGAGWLPWPPGMHGAWGRIQPVQIRGIAPAGTTAVRYTIHDKGVVMGQGSVTPDASGHFALTYDARALHEDFSMVSLTAREGIWEGLADEVAINLLAEGSQGPAANTVTLIGEEVFVGRDVAARKFLPLLVR